MRKSFLKLNNISKKIETLVVSKILLMTLPNIFTSEVSQKLINRINQLSPESKPQWGKMSVDQMLAHCNVTYEMAIDNSHPKAGGFKRFLLKTFIKNTVVTAKPYKKNSPTAPAFKIVDKKNFDNEKTRLINYLNKTVELGEKHFDGKESNSFGALNIDEWNTMFYKHLDYHFNQFGV